MNVEQLAQQLPAVAFLLWLCRHVVAIVIPGIIKDFRDELQAERESHAAQIDKLIAHCEGHHKQG